MRRNPNYVHMRTSGFTDRFTRDSVSPSVQPISEPGCFTEVCGLKSLRRSCRAFSAPCASELSACYAPSTVTLRLEPSTASHTRLHHPCHLCRVEPLPTLGSSPTVAASVGICPPTAAQLAEERPDACPLFRHLPALRSRLAWREIGTFPTPVHRLSM